MSNLIVSKFGGSATGNSEGVREILRLIKSNPSRRYVVVSAPGNTNGKTGITDMLYICHSVFRSAGNYKETLKEISDRYKEIIDGLGVYFDIDSEIENLKKDLESGKSLDYIASRGEYITGKILAELSGRKFIDPSELIFFNFDGTVDKNKTLSESYEILRDVECAVIPGFYGSMPDGNIKTFPRGDGDTTGALIACAVNADCFEKWSETSKTYGADPSVIPDAKVILNITYSEAVELNYIGIKTIRDSVIFMMKDAEIPIRICSITTPDEGMLISSEIPENASRRVAACIAGRRNFNVVHIEKYGLNKLAGFGEKLFGIFAKYGAPCEHCLSGIYKMSIVLKHPMFDLRRKEILDEIKNVIEPDSLYVEKDLALIAVIGDGMGKKKGAFSKVFEAMVKAQIKPRMIDQGSDDMNIILGVDGSDYEKAVKFLYETMIL